MKGARLKEIREHLGMSQKQFAEDVLGLVERSVRRYEADEREINPAHAAITEKVFRDPDARRAHLREMRLQNAAKKKSAKARVK